MIAMAMDDEIKIDVVEHAYGTVIDIQSTATGRKLGIYLNEDSTKENVVGSTTMSAETLFDSIEKLYDDKAYEEHQKKFN